MIAKKNILVTGSTGFLGTHLVNRLIEEGYRVYEVNTRIADIRIKGSLDRFLGNRIDHVFHLAALTFVPASWENPDEFTITNVLGTVNVLDFCRKAGASLTFLSSYLYGNPDHLPIDENACVKVNNPYAASKEAGELVCRHYHQLFEVKVVIARPFNVYGPGQNEKFIIPKIIKNAIKHGHIEVDDLSPKRDFIFISDLIDGLVKTINIKASFEVFNFGSGVSYSIREIIELVEEVLKKKLNVTSKGITRNNEIMDTLADVSKAKELLGWETTTSFKEGIRNIINY